MAELPAEFWLLIDTGRRIYRYRIRQSVVAVGSAEDNQVRIQLPSVAAHHVLLSFVEGRFHLRRVEEAPVFVNGERMDRWSDDLEVGSVMRLGDVHLWLAEGGPVSDVAVHLLVTPPEGSGGHLSQTYLCRRREFLLGGGGTDLPVPGLQGTWLLLENFGSCGVFAVPVEGAPGPVRIQGRPVESRTRVRHLDMIQFGGATAEVRLLKGEALDRPEMLLSTDQLKRMEAPPVLGGA